MTQGVHPFPSRTRKLSPVVPKILGWRRPGKIGRCQHSIVSILLFIVMVIMMSVGLWNMNDWYNILDYENSRYRYGLRLRFDKGINPSLRNECLRFAAWLRQEYDFPIRIPIYFKNKKCLICLDGDTAYGTCFLPDTYNKEPYIRIAVGDYDDLCSDWGEWDATLSILRTIAHELTHYYQWINGVRLTEKDEERQATRISKLIIEYYLSFISND